jgi:M6 family metalloprotease-like protein
MRLKGDARYHWLEDINGYTVLKNNENWYVYADRFIDGTLRPTSAKVGRADAESFGLKPHLLPDATILDELTRERLAVPTPDFALSGPQPLSVSASGTIKNLVILMRFSNHGPDDQDRDLPSAADFDLIFNSVGGDPDLAPSGSVRDYYFESSYGQMTLDSTVVGWVDLPETEQFYADGESGLTSTIWEAIEVALEEADPLVDFSEFDEDLDGFVDSIAFVHSGYAAEFGGDDEYGTPNEDRIWSHRWSIPEWESDEGVKVRPYHVNPGLWGTEGSDPGRIGVICHETGHFFGLPDLYDRNGGGAGLGRWGLMGSGSWGFEGTQRYPTHFCAWSKVQLGWVEPQIITPGDFDSDEVETIQDIKRIDWGYPDGEYLLIENRQPVGFDQEIPQGGLAIWHIDENKANNNSQGYPGQDGWPENNRHYKIALLQADGLYDLEQGENRGDDGDLYHGDGVALIDDMTVPNTDSYQDGIIVVNGNSISEITVSASMMNFTFTGPAAPVITTSELPPAVQGQPYNATLDVSGGTAPFQWCEYIANPLYTQTEEATSLFVAGGVGQGWQEDEGSWTVMLPFPFYYYEHCYDRVKVTPNGYMELASGGLVDFTDSEFLLSSNVRIAPLWQDIRTDDEDAGDDIFLDDSSPGRLTIRWQGKLYTPDIGDGEPVNFSATFFDDNRIRFDYGSGNMELDATIGISRGDDSDYFYMHSDDFGGEMTDEASITFAHSGSQIPPGLSLSMAGELSGTPTETGAFTMELIVDDGVYLSSEGSAIVVVTTEASAGDFDGDGDVDLIDFGNFQLCFTGTDGVLPPECEAADFDDDNDADLVDFGGFQLAFTGS